MPSLFAICKHVTQLSGKRSVVCVEKMARRDLQQATVPLLSTPSRRLPFALRFTASLLSFILFLTSGPAAFAITLGTTGGTATGTAGRGTASNLQNAGAASAQMAATQARKSIEQSETAVGAMRAMQQNAAAAARAVARSGTPLLPNGQPIPNGLAVNWLHPHDGFDVNGKPLTTSWRGASINMDKTGMQSSGDHNVEITQSEQSAYIYWKNFNVGPRTTLNFDQSKGGPDAGKWIAFNKITGTASPSSVYGKINSQGQVYILNQNGIMFHNGSEVNVHALVASTLPINPYLAGDPIKGISGNGLLNNPGAQFLFSALPFSQSANTFQDAPKSGDPQVALKSTEVGAVHVAKGASITTAASETPGRVMLVGPSVINEGTIVTPEGQTILAAGLQVGVADHPANDPSLRGLDVYVGKVTDLEGNSAGKVFEDDDRVTRSYSVGTVVNKGLIETLRGAASFSGRYLKQDGVVESSTSVSLNGRIDFLAAYNAVVSSTATAMPYYFDALQPEGSTGEIVFGPGSSTRILPDSDKKNEKTIGTRLSLPSVVSVIGNSILFDQGSVLLAPGASSSPDPAAPFFDMTTLARLHGKDRTDTTLDGASSITAVLSSGISVSAGNFVRTKSGSAWSESSTFLLGKVGDSLPAGSIIVRPDARIDASGTTGTQVSVAENFATIQLRGPELANSPLQRESLVRGKDISVDLRVNGTFNGQYWVGTPLGDATGYAGLVQRTVAQLTRDGGSVALRAGDSVSLDAGSLVNVSGGWVQYTGDYVSTTKLYYLGSQIDISQATPDRIYGGIVKDVTKRYESGYYEGGDGGSITLQGSDVALQGNLAGTVVNGARQLRATQTAGSLAKPAEFSITLKTETLDGGQRFNGTPKRNTVLFGNSIGNAFTTVLNPTWFGGNGFGSLSVANHDGSVLLPSGTLLDLGPHGTLSLDASIIAVGGGILAPGGSVTAAVRNFNFVEIESVIPGEESSRLAGKAGSGVLSLLEGGFIDVSGLVAIDLPGSLFETPLMLDGGRIDLSGYRLDMRKGSRLAADAGAQILLRKTFYGQGGDLILRGGRDTEIQTVHDGSIVLDAAISAYGGIGKRGGSLDLAAPAFLIGSASTVSGVLSLSSGFFSSGGFSDFTLKGTGIESARSGGNEIAGIRVLGGTEISPRTIFLQYDMKGQKSFGTFSSPFQHAVSVSLKSDVLYNEKKKGDAGSLVTKGLLLIEDGAVFRLDAGAIPLGKQDVIPSTTTAMLNLAGGVVEFNGKAFVPGGSITVAGAGDYPADQPSLEFTARATVMMGRSADLSTAGTVLGVRDPMGLGRRLGKVLEGGSITLSGNLRLDEGSILNVSGATGDFYVPSVAGKAASSLGSLTRVDSSGGSIKLAGSHMMVSLAALSGNAGGEGARGGSLSVSSGRFYSPDPVRSEVYDPRDFTLELFQGNRAMSIAVASDRASGLSSGGYFSADSLKGSGLESLNLSGNVRFHENTTIDLGNGMIRLADGGVLGCAAGVPSQTTLSVTAGYVALGKPLVGPLIENDPEQRLSYGFGAAYGYDAPSAGAGCLVVNASNVDVGTLLFKGISTAGLTASGGMIRGDGTVDIAGQLTMTAPVVSPVTAGIFRIFAFDSPGKLGRITFRGNGEWLLPLEAGGKITVQASVIDQGGVISAPLGNISLGWNGVDGSSAVDPLSGAGGLKAGISAPVTTSLFLGPESMTSTAAIDPSSGKDVSIPYGVILNQTEWVDPRGVTISASGPGSKSVNLSSGVLSMSPGAIVDARGGGDLLAYHWESGLQGSIDPTSQPSGGYAAGSSYAVGDKVVYGGRIYSARRNGKLTAPRIGSEWSEVTEGFAILPSYEASLAPFLRFFSTSSTGGDPGYVSSLSPGDRISLAGGAGLAPGEYTLLPSRYGILPGAYLVTPTGEFQGTFAPVIRNLDGTVLSAGYRLNAFGSTSQQSPVRGMYEITSSGVLGQKAKYTVEYASGFFTSSTDNLPRNASSVSILGKSSLDLRGRVIGSSVSGGAGSLVSISSSSPFFVGSGAIPPGSLSVDPSVINRWSFGTLLLGGSLGNVTPDGGRQLNVSTESVEIAPGATLSGSEIIIAATKSILMDKGSSLISTGAGSSQLGALSVTGDGVLLRVSGDRAVADVSRSGFSADSRVGITLADGVTLGGGSILVDSSGGSSFEGSVSFAGIGPQSSPAVALKSGAIALLLSPSDQAVSDLGLHAASSLVLSGETLAALQAASSLSLTSYSSLDFFGSGSFGNPSLSLELHTGGIRGFDAAGGTVQLVAGSILLDNASSAKSITPVTSISDGSLELLSPVISLGNNTVKVDQFEYVHLAASEAIRVAGKGGIEVGDSFRIYKTTSEDENLTLAELAERESLSSRGFDAVAAARVNALDADALLTSGRDLLIPQSSQHFFLTTPKIIGMAESSMSLKASGSMSLDAPDPQYARATDLEAGLGSSLSLEGDAVYISSQIILPSGSFTAKAHGGDIVLGGYGNAAIDVSGSKKAFHDAVKFTDAGTITFSTDSGSVVLGSTSQLKLSADQDGGSAGILSISAPVGRFAIDSTAILDGDSGANGKKGTFILDTSNLGGGEGTSYVSSIAAKLADGKFTDSLSLRIRSGDVEVDSYVKAHSFTLAADQGSIFLTPEGVIDASGVSKDMYGESTGETCLTGGVIALSASGSVILDFGSLMTVRGDEFDAAGKGGSVVLSAGVPVSRIAEDGSTYLDINRDAVVDLRTASSIDLGVNARPQRPDQFTGTLHLRAPVTADGSDIQIASLDATITGASGIMVEGYRAYDLTGSSGEITDTLKSGIAADSAAFFGSVGGNSESASALLSRLTLNQGESVAGILNLAPGVEIINRSGGLSLNQDWDLSTWRYGANAVPGFLTLRATGDIVLNASLSDGFKSAMYDAHLLDFNPLLEPNFQSWAYTISAGGDLTAADPSRVAGSGSLKLGKPTLNSNAYDGSMEGTVVKKGQNALLSDLIGDSYQVIRTGSGNINISAATDIQFLNQFATIYTAGTRDKDPTLGGAFDLHQPNPSYELDNSSDVLGRVQQEVPYPSQFSFAGGNIILSAGRNIAHLQIKTKAYQDLYEGDPLLTMDSSRQLPNNWISRRGGVDATGQWVTMPIAAGGTETYSTAWWINFANYFEGVASLGGGNVTLLADGSIVNIDASIATQGRLTARSSDGKKLAPSSGTLVETGGGDLVVRAKGDINAGVYYVEKGNGLVSAGGSIVSNYTRDASGGYLSSLQEGGDVKDAQMAKSHPETWLPTSFFLGNATMSVTSGRGMLLGPVANVFLMPQGVDDGIRNKSYFSTYGDKTSFSALSLGGDITLRTALSASIGNPMELPAFQAWSVSSALSGQSISLTSPGSLMPWIRLAESDPSNINLGTAMALMPSLLSISSLSGGVALAGDLTLAPEARGGIEILTLNGIDGIYPVVSGARWGSSVINVSDAPQGSIPSMRSPLSQTTGSPALLTESDYLNGLTFSLEETASFTGENALISSKSARHDSSLLHTGDPDPVRINSLKGMVGNLTLFSPKRAEIRAGTEIANIQLVIQNLSSEDVSIVSSGSGMVLYNANTDSRLAALKDVPSPEFVSGPFAGDIQISGPGKLLIQSGGSIDLGTGSQNSDGTGAGITSIGNARNPYLPFQGADINITTGYDPSYQAGMLSLLTAVNSMVESSWDSMRGKVASSTDPQVIAQWKKLNDPASYEFLVSKDILWTILHVSESLKQGQYGNLDQKLESQSPVLNDFLLSTKTNLQAILDDSAGSSLLDQKLQEAGFTIEQAQALAKRKRENPQYQISMDDLWNSIGANELSNTLRTEIFGFWNGINKRSDLSVVTKLAFAEALFNNLLKKSGRNVSNPDSPEYKKYDLGNSAISKVFGTDFQGSGSVIARSRNLRTKSGGSIVVSAPRGGVTLANTTIGLSLAPPGIVTEYGGSIDVFTRNSVDIGIGRIFTLRGGDIMIYSDKGNIAAGSSAKTVATAPPTRAILDPQSADVQTDLAGLATGGGIGVLALVKDIPPANVDLIAPSGFIDAGDAGIRSTGNLNLAAEKILNADNILAGGVTVGAPPPAAPSAPPPAAPPPAAPPAGATAAAAAGNSSAENAAAKNARNEQGEQPPSIFTIDVLGYGGGDDDDEEKKSASTAQAPVQASL